MADLKPTFVKPELPNSYQRYFEKLFSAFDGTNGSIAPDCVLLISHLKAAYAKMLVETQKPFPPKGSARRFLSLLLFLMRNWNDQSIELRNKIAFDAKRITQLPIFSHEDFEIEINAVLLEVRELFLKSKKISTRVVERESSLASPSQVSHSLLRESFHDINHTIAELIELRLALVSPALPKEIVGFVQNFWALKIKSHVLKGGDDYFKLVGSFEWIDMLVRSAFLPLRAADQTAWVLTVIKVREVLLAQILDQGVGGSNKREYVAIIDKMHASMMQQLIDLACWEPEGGFNDADLSPKMSAILKHEAIKDELSAERSNSPSAITRQHKKKHENLKVFLELLSEMKSGDKAQFYNSDGHLVDGYFLGHKKSAPFMVFVSAKGVELFRKKPKVISVEMSKGRFFISSEAGGNKKLLYAFRRVFGGFSLPRRL